MKKPNKQDLDRIINELREMASYIAEKLPVSRYLTPTDEIYGSLTRAIDELENVIIELPNIRDNITEE